MAMAKICSMCESDTVYSNAAKYCMCCKISAYKYGQLQYNSSSGYGRNEDVKIEISKVEFCKWRKSVEQICHYCEIPENHLRGSGFKSQIQKPLDWIGVDRIDSNLGYFESNLVPCCFVCNQIKGNRFSELEMRFIGQSIKRIWQRRIGI